MSQVSEKVFKLYNQLTGDEIQPIEESVVDDAVSIINSIDPVDTETLFVILSAVNLLNAAIKTEKHKAQLFYGFIKTRVSKIAEYVLRIPSNFHDTAIFYDKKQKCIYFQVLDVIFSFHQIQETKIIKSVAASNPVITWTGIRLQRIAPKLYLFSKTEFMQNIDIQNSTPKEGNRNDSFLSRIKLKPCPDCGLDISVSAQSCPNCGCMLESSCSLLDGLKEGYSVKITYSGLCSSGKIESIGNGIVSLLLFDEKWLRVRTSSITSVELIDTNSFSTELFAQQAEAFFLHIFELSQLDKESFIKTNSTITKVDKQGLTVITDSGETVICIKPGIVGYKKKDCTVGK